MMSFMQKRWWFYLTALGMSVAASVWISIRDKDQEPVHAHAQHVIAILPAREEEASAGFVLPVREFPESGVLEDDHNPFAAVGKVAAAPPPAPPPPATPRLAAQEPAVPPLPFSYRGVLKDSTGAWVVQLARGKDYLSAGRGDVIDSNYRLDEMSDDELRFTYLPMSAVQILPIPTDPPQ